MSRPRVTPQTTTEQCPLVFKKLMVNLRCVKYWSIVSLISKMLMWRHNCKTVFVVQSVQTENMFVWTTQSAPFPCLPDSCLLDKSICICMLLLSSGSCESLQGCSFFLFRSCCWYVIPSDIPKTHKLNIVGFSRSGRWDAPDSLHVHHLLQQHAAALCFLTPSLCFYRTHSGSYRK